MKRVIAIPGLMAAVLMIASLGGCNTVAGAGRDVQAVGGGITHIAREVNKEVFGNYGERDTPRGVASAGDPCDPEGDELLGGQSGLPAC